MGLSNYYSLFGLKLTKTQYIILLFTIFFVYNMVAAILINWVSPIAGWILVGLEVLFVIIKFIIGVINVIKDYKK